MAGGNWEDVQEIQNLALRYARNVDRHDGEAFADLFTEDAVLDGSGYLSEGREQLARIPNFTARRWAKTFHAVHNHLISIEGDRATGEVYCTARHLKDEGGAMTDLEMVIRYQDAYARTSGGWRFARRTLIVEWTETRAAAAHTPPPPR
jgi:uncharacterized protein (TIGR02246 family)